MKRKPFNFIACEGYIVYTFQSAPRHTKDMYGNDYVLKDGVPLLKLPTHFLDWIRGKSWYFNLKDFHIIDCGGYIEERCLIGVWKY